MSTDSSVGSGRRGATHLHKQTKQPVILFAAIESCRRGGRKRLFLFCVVCYQSLSDVERDGIGRRRGLWEKNLGGSFPPVQTSQQGPPSGPFLSGAPYL